MKIDGRKNYKSGSSKDNCGSPPYAVMPIIPQIEDYRIKLGLKRSEFTIWEPAPGTEERPLLGLVTGFTSFGYNVIYELETDFITCSLQRVDALTPKGIQMIVTNPPYGVGIKRKFINTVKLYYNAWKIPYALLMMGTTHLEKINGQTLKGCSIHVPYGRINFSMPNKGWGTPEEPTQATFSTSWYSQGLGPPSRIYYSDFDVSDHFLAMEHFLNE